MVLNPTVPLRNFFETLQKLDPGTPPSDPNPKAKVMKKYSIVCSRKNNQTPKNWNFYHLIQEFKAKAMTMKQGGSVQSRTTLRP